MDLPIPIANASGILPETRGPTTLSHAVMSAKPKRVVARALEIEDNKSR